MPDLWRAQGRALTPLRASGRRRRPARLPAASRDRRRRDARGALIPVVCGGACACACWRVRETGRYVSVNGTHVVVGHERSDGAGGTVLDTVAFAAASSPAAAATLADPTRYTSYADPVQRRAGRR